MENAIKVKGLSKKYNTFSLDNINLVIPKGYIVGLILSRENREGKSATIKSILNLIQKDSGSIQMFNQDHAKHEKELKEEIGVVFDESHFPKQLTAKDLNLIMKHIYRNWDKPIYLDYLHQFNIPEKKL